eukprot:CAMPEP_0116141732 /NCGR_PEP_ID=MMETSP0329-20121206/14534_1 /TAXON_ID=697910 /ORGANISM="Pseudo-nitzschia arenysensis, Strain B593" /LENGTH=214 /DNA_ID=CAMNT_0003636925 /DNA_START=46 /DNA_END=690 /DNA_ORIENTATION=+
MPPSQEKTPLLNSGNNKNAYYFQTVEKKGNSFRATSDQDGGKMVETLPAGSTEADFAPRVIGTSNKKKGKSEPAGFFAKLFGSGKAAKKEPPRSVKPRKAPIKIEPKVFFSNERTFLAWMHVSVILAGASVAILALSDYENISKQLYGLIMLPVAVSFLVYAMYQYIKRSYMIRHKLPGPYEDTVGPVVLSVMLMISITAQFAIKLVSSTSSEY